MAGDAHTFFFFGVLFFPAGSKYPLYPFVRIFRLIIPLMVILLGIDFFGFVIHGVVLY